MSCAVLVLGVPASPKHTSSSSFSANTPHPTHFQPSMDLPYYEVNQPLSLPPNTAFADGSFFPSISQCASSVVLPNHRACILKPRGRPSCYRAEVFALALAVDLVGPGSTIFTDSAAALSAVKGTSPRVTLAGPVHHIRQAVAHKQLTLQHVRGHQGVMGNEMADKIAKEACNSLPPPPPQARHSPWDVCVEGELQHPPQKTWGYCIPRHSHQDIHPWSWKPIVLPGWLPWLFGAKSIKGFAHPSSYWRNLSSVTPCPHCSAFHNSSVRGSIGLCNAPSQNPLVKAWLQSWGVHMPIIAAWRETASPSDRFLLGKLVIPVSLVAHLQSLVGARLAWSAVRHFQRPILHSLAPCLPVWSPDDWCTFKRKLNPYAPDGWDQGPHPLPPHRRPARLRKKSAPNHAPTTSITSYVLPQRPSPPDKCS